MPANHFQRNGVFYIATAAGMAAGWFDLLRVPWVINALLLLAGGALLGWKTEQPPRSLALSLGFGPFLLQLAVLMLDLMPEFKQNLFFSLLGLIPAYAGVYGVHLIIRHRTPAPADGS
jgi:hypothetical protein